MLRRSLHELCDRAAGGSDGGGTSGAMICPSCQAENDRAAQACGACGRALAAPPTLGTGSVVAARYEILSSLGAGGMGMVFKAHDRALDETVAIKIVRGAASDPDMAARFRSEVKLAWKVRHRNVCGIHEYGEDGDLLYISMELVQGRDLKHILQEKGAFVWEEAYDIASQVVDGLQAIHEAEVIHRDLKAANIMRDPRGVVRLMDFGIAKVWGDDRGAGITVTGQVVGSPEYMSPEQVRGRRIDYRSDIYAFGILLFEIFTGRVPFRAATPVATMLLHLEQPPPLEGPAARQIPVALLPVLKKALAKEPAERYATCRELALALREARAALERQVTDVVSAGASKAGTAAPAATAPGVADAAGEEEATRIVPGLKASRSSRPAPKEAQLLVAPLLKALKHADASVRAGAARALGRVGPDAGDTLSALTAAERDEDEGVRAAAAAAAARLKAIPTPASEAQAVSAVLPIVVPVATPPVVAPVAAPEAPRFAPPQAPSPAPAPAPPPPPSPPGSRSVALPSREALAEPQQAPQSYRRRPALVFAPETPRSRLPVAFTAGASALACAGLVALWLSHMTPPAPSTASVAVPPTTVPDTFLATTPASLAPSLAPSPAAPPIASPRTPVAPAIQKAIVTPASAPPPVSSPSVSVEPSPPVAEPTPTTAPTPPSPTPEAPPPPTAAPPPVFVDPQCLSCPRPEYPWIAAQRKVEGTVRLRLLIDAQGAVTKVEVVSGIDLLTDAAVNSAKRRRYRPKTRDGVAVESLIEVGVTFELER